MRRVLVIHIMKTGGTSVRHMLESVIGRPDVYPNGHDLAQRERRWYPGTHELLRHDREGKSRHARVLIGHLPFVAVEELSPRPLVVAMVRDPIARTVSMLEHRRRESPDLARSSYAEFLDDEEFVERQIRNYQTKVFAFDSIAECPRSVNVPRHIDGERFARALSRLRSVDVLGVTENVPAFARRLSDVAGIDLTHIRHDNPGGYNPHALPADVLEHVKELTALDRELYERACHLVGDAQSCLTRMASG